MRRRNGCRIAPGCGAVQTAGGKGEGLVFRKGEILRKVPENELVRELFKEIDALLAERRGA